MVRELARNWWLILLRGVLSIVFGILAFTQPETTAVALAIIFGAYAIVDGVANIASAVRGDTRHRAPYILAGALGVIAGVIAFALPGLTFLTFVYLIAVWAIVTGVMEIVAGIRLRDEIDNELWLWIGGALSVLFGVIVVRDLPLGGLTILFLIGAYAVVYGVVLIFLSLRLKGVAGRRPARA